MMLLDINQNAEQLKLQVSNELDKLKQFAELSIVESHNEKDQYHSDCKKLIGELSIDSINGGIFEFIDHQLQMSLVKNCLLAEFLLASGLTFFDGDLTYIGQKTLSSLVNNLFDHQQNNYFSQLSYNKNTSPFLIEGDVLQSILNSDELNLLAAMLDVEGFEKNIKYWLGYKVAIRNAALISGINFKQAQILEHSIQLKLVGYQQKNPIKATFNQQLDLSSNAQMLYLLVQAIVWFKQDQYIAKATQLKQSLFKIIQQKIDLTNSEIIEICYALIEYNQIVFEENTIKLIAEKLDFLDENKLISEVAKTKLALLISFLNQLNPNRISHSFIKRFQLVDNQHSIDLVYLSGTVLENEKIKENLLSSYNPYLKILKQ